MPKYFNHGMRGGTDGFVNNNRVYLEFFHLPTNKIVRFKAFITDFSESYDVRFDEQDVYGRMDPIATYEGTKRKINLSWMTVAESHAEAYQNWKRVQDYIKMMYPSYKKFVFEQGGDSGRFSATTLAAPPLLKLKFMNLIADASQETIEKKNVVSNVSVNSKTTVKKNLIEYTTGNVRENGLLVVPSALSVNPNFVDRAGILSGGKQVDPAVGPPTTRPVEYEDYVSSNKFFVPIEVTLSTEFTVLHQHDLGTEKEINLFKAQLRNEFIRQQITGLKQAAKWNWSHQRNDKIRKGASEHFKKLISQQKKLLKNITTTPVRDKKGFENFPYGIKK